jgi:hypothetical protein
MKLAVTARGTTSPYAFAHDEVIAISGLRADEDASSVLGMVTASAGILGGLASP